MAGLVTVDICSFNHLWIGVDNEHGHMSEKKPYQWLAWTGTTVLIVAAMLAAFNQYPYYVYLFCMANSIWVIVGLLWRENSLVVLNAGLTLIYLAGLIWA
jgi:hypothetical protein